MLLLPPIALPVGSEVQLKGEPGVNSLRPILAYGNLWRGGGGMIRHDALRVFRERYSLLVQRLSAKEQKVGELLRTTKINSSD